MRCSECGAKTLGFMITVQGGTRLLSVAVPRGRKPYCVSCGTERIADMNARDRRRARIDAESQEA